MRAALPRFDGTAKTLPDHAGLAYEVWAAFSDKKGEEGKIPDDDRPKWLAAVAGILPSPDYPKAFERWKESFERPGDVTVVVEATSRLLVGHGLGSATDVGLTLHRTWGVPLIPGSALKGLLAHWVEATLGPAPGERDEQRLRFAGVVWDGRRIAEGPGEVYRALFGAPEADEAVPRPPNLAAAGLVAFHDALWVPDRPGASLPLAVDVLTVHQKRYYDKSGENWPVDWDDPNPVSFLSVRPGARFLLALSGPPDWTALAKDLLLEALADWGVGGKTSAGYGRFRLAEGTSSTSTGKGSGGAASVPPPAEGSILDCILVERLPTKQWRVRHEPSGLRGLIQNSQKVPADLKEGAPIRLKLVRARGNDSRFEVP
jgi:CRISPR-associated protein Cmr6